MALVDTARIGAMLVEIEEVALEDDEVETQADHVVSKGEEDEGVKEVDCEEEYDAVKEDDTTAEEVSAAATGVSRGVVVDVDEAVLEVQVVSLPYWRRWRW